MLITKKKPKHKKTKLKVKDKEPKKNIYEERLKVIKKNKYKNGIKHMHYNISQFGGVASLFIMAKGLGNACAKIATNPIIMGFGVLVGLMSLGYALWNYLNN